MIQRLLNISKSHSFFLFGGRGTGKTHYLKEAFSKEAAILIDLLKPEEFFKLNREPEILTNRIESSSNKNSWVIIDEIQKSLNY